MNADVMTDVTAIAAPTATMAIRRDSRNDKLAQLRSTLGPGKYRQIAKRISRDHRYITRVLSGIAPRPSAKIMEEIADATHVPVGDVMWYVRAMQDARRE